MANAVDKIQVFLLLESMDQILERAVVPGC